MEPEQQQEQQEQQEEIEQQMEQQGEQEGQEQRQEQEYVQTVEDNPEPQVDEQSQELVEVAEPVEEKPEEEQNNEEDTVTTNGSAVILNESQASINEQVPQLAAQADELPQAPEEENKQEQQNQEHPIAQEQPVRANLRRSHNIRPVDFEHMVKISIDEKGTPLPFPFEITGIEYETGTPTIVIRIPTPKYSKAENLEIRRKVSDLAALSYALKCTEGYRCAVPPAPTVEAFWSLKSHQARSVQFLLVKNYFQFITLHRVLRNARAFELFFITDAADVDHILRLQDQKETRAKVEVKVSVSQRANMMVRKRISLAKLKVPLHRKDRSEQQQEAEAQQQQQKKSETTTAPATQTAAQGTQPGQTRDAVSVLLDQADDTVQINITNWINAHISEFDQMYSQANDMWLKSKAFSHSSHHFGRSAVKVAKKLRSNLQDLRNGTVFEPTTASETKNSTPNMLPGDVPVATLRPFLADNMPCEHTSELGGVGQALMSSGFLYRDLTSQIQLYAVTPLYLVVNYLQSLLPMLEYRRSLLVGCQQSRFELLRSGEKLEKIQARYKKAQDEKDARAQQKYHEKEKEIKEERHERAKNLQELQTTLVSTTNSFFYNFSTVCKATSNILQMVSGDLAKSIEDAAGALSKLWNEPHTLNEEEKEAATADEADSEISEAASVVSVHENPTECAENRAQDSA